MRTEPIPLQETGHLFLAHEARLRNFIRKFIRDDFLVEDTLSQAKEVVLTSEYDPARAPFERWALGICRRIALTNWHKETAERLFLEDAAAECLAEQVEQLAVSLAWEDQKAALLGCLTKLPPRHQELIDLLYYENRSYPEIAQRAGKTISAMYVVFNRLRSTLQTCIRRHLEDL